MTTPMVSVCMITYNHEKFIAQAIEGVLMQKTDFPIELIISDDCSPDNTKAIIEKYAKENPLIIKPIYRNPNLGMIPNFVDTVSHCTGKYIALCEGDDYWTDPLKLQKQVDFLEANEEYSICHHNMKVIYDDSSREPWFFNSYNPKGDTTISDLAKRNYISTASCVFRNHLFQQFPEWYAKCPIGDYPLHLLNAQFGRIHFIPDVMGTYRVHKGGVWETKDRIFQAQKMIEALELLKDYFEPTVNTILRNQQNKEYERLLNEDKIDSEKCKHYSERIIENDPFYLINLHEEISRLKLLQNAMEDKIRNTYTYKLGEVILSPITFIVKLFKKSK